MSARLIGKFLKEFDTILAEGTKLSSETQKGIKTLIKASPEIKSGEAKVADVIEDKLIRKSVLKRVGDYAPSTKEYLNIGTKEFSLTQKSTERPIIEARKEKKLESVKSYLEENINALKKGKGNFENLLNPIAADKLGMSTRNWSIYKKEANVKLPEKLQPIFDYFNKFATSERYKRMSGQTKFTPKLVKEIQQENIFANKLRANSPEEVVQRFLYRSHRQPGTDVKLLNPSETGNWKKMKFQIGGRKITYDDIKKGIAENDPLFSEIKSAYDYKKAVLKTKVMNPKTSMLESLNKAAFDVLGKNGKDLFHMSHIYGVSRTPLNYIQITFGPYNRQMHQMLKGKKIPGGYESFLERTEAVNLANPFAPDFIKKTPQEFAEEAAFKLNEFYKLQKKNKNVKFSQFMKFNKGGIIDLIR